MTRSFFSLLNASPDSPSSFLPPLIHFSFLEPVSRPQTVRFTRPGYFGVFDPGKPLWALQAEPAPSRRLVPLLVTFVAIWAGTRVCPFSPAGQDLGREFADAPLGLCFRDSRHLLVICCYSGVPPRGALAVWLWFSDTSFPSGLGPDPSAESSCHKRNDRVLCTFESLTPSSYPLVGELRFLWDLFEVRPSWQPWGSISTSSSNSRLQPFVSPGHLLSFIPLQTVNKMSYLHQNSTLSL